MHVIRLMREAFSPPDPRFGYDTCLSRSDPESGTGAPFEFLTYERADRAVEIAGLADWDFHEQTSSWER